MKHLLFKLQSFLVLLVFTAASAYAQKSPVDMNRFIDDLMKKMTLEEKIGQLNLGLRVGVVLDTLHGLCGKVALYRTPLVVPLFHILPVYPCCGVHVPYVLYEPLCQFQVAGQS